MFAVKSRWRGAAREPNPMHRVFADTNVFLRSLTQDDLDKALSASTYDGCSFPLPLLPVGGSAVGEEGWGNEGQPAGSAQCPGK